MAASTIPKQQHGSFSASFSYLNLSHWKLCIACCLNIFLYKKRNGEEREGGWHGAVVSLYLVTRAHNVAVYAYNFQWGKEKGPEG